jgi:kinesin family protein 6/9
MDPNLVIKRLKGELLNLREEVNYLKGETGEGDDLSPQELEDLRNLCRNYCYDRDPNSLLNIGALTLTKIKRVFEIFKALVQDAFAEGGGSGGGGGGSGPASSKGGNFSKEDLNDLEKYRKQVGDLKSLLLQRDSEINILVNMVKKNKTIDVPENMENDGDAVDFSMVKDQINSVMNSNSQKMKKQHQQAKEEPKDKNDGRMSKELQMKIIERHLFGVPPPTDHKIFEDSEAAFSWFKEKCSISASIAENKEILKSKIGEAKTLGLQAEQSRKTIDYLKKTIEQIRRDRALQGLNNLDNPTNEPQESQEEESHRRAIEQEKVVYTDSVNRLKELKPQIEHIKKVILIIFYQFLLALFC